MTRGDESPDHGLVPVGVDTTRASATRVSDAMLGGKDNFQIDRDMKSRMVALDPHISRASQDRRDFVLRVTRYLADEVGITQFLVCGTTLPEAENPHQVAQRINHDASMVYVSTDLTVLAHGRALLADNDRTHMAEADFRRPSQVLRHPTVTRYLDLSQPTALFHIGTMHFIPDAHDPAAVLGAYVDAVPSGSYVVFAHYLDPGTDDESSHLAAELMKIYADFGIDAWFRTREQVTEMLGAVEVLEPGLVPLALWWPDGPPVQPLGLTQRLAAGGLCRKP